MSTAEAAEGVWKAGVTLVIALIVAPFVAIATGALFSAFFDIARILAPETSSPFTGAYESVNAAAQMVFGLFELASALETLAYIVAFVLAVLLLLSRLNSQGRRR